MFDSPDPLRAAVPDHPAADRDALLTRVHRIAAEHAGGYREGLTRSAALAELAELAPGPEVLARAAAMHAVADNWYAIVAVDLLLEAGAPRHLLDLCLDEGWTDPETAPDEPPRRVAAESD